MLLKELSGSELTKEVNVLRRALKDAAARAMDRGVPLEDLERAVTEVTEYIDAMMSTELF